MGQPYPSVTLAVRQSERLLTEKFWEEARAAVLQGLHPDEVLDRIHKLYVMAADDYNSDLMRRCVEESRHREFKNYVAAKLGLA